MARTSSARDRILRAFENMLLNDGERAATLDAVAAAAGVSKGGLLYHFGSREALAEGLIERLKELAELDLTEMAQAPEGPAKYYIRTSGQTDSELDRVIVAALRLAQGQEEHVRSVFAGIQLRWFELICEEIGDPTIAQTIILIGDGMYYNASLHGQGLGVADTAYPQGLESLQGVIEALKLLAQAKS
ncbi:AcrR family transcriptional regulator [Psychromicrobium silvestre]|uniref:AcrR family transcriptional regulator n=1 Tax=Psychromicrobium silvestre TaxID=1645614 RepID=A0A7Y9LTK9_9MICC|nr:TetR/AcrR family transcriptional regulator [Psychromicrobium silvestre]NYE95350.1 AcrR family transcriptional regulator [Psychromicrobium silvestre]